MFLSYSEIIDKVFILVESLKWIQLNRNRIFLNQLTEIGQKAIKKFKKTYGISKKKFVNNIFKLQWYCSGRKRKENCINNIKANLKPMDENADKEKIVVLRNKYYTDNKIQPSVKLNLRFFSGDLIVSHKHSNQCKIQIKTESD